MLRFPWRTANRSTARQLATPAGLRELVDAARTAAANTTGAVQDLTGTSRALAALGEEPALNATIEAARAGESGRGFAVVAGEKTLAADVSGSAQRLAQGVSG